MKKILILTVTAGNGHNSNAKAMKEHLQNLDGTAEIEIVDVLKEYSSKLNVWTVDRKEDLIAMRKIGVDYITSNVFDKNE